MSNWPDYVTEAFSATGYEDYEEEIEAFRSRWGDLEISTFLRVLEEGAGEDKLLAIFAVGYQESPEARARLLPLLHSPKPRERWASALCLGKMKEEQALPVLLRMLTEFFPPAEWPSYEGGDLWYYNGCRLEALLILSEWARPDIVPALLDALSAFMEQEQRIPAWNAISRRYWRWCQGRVMYALGWLGRFDILDNLDVGEPTRSSWRVYLALGSLHAHTTHPDVFVRSLRFQPALRKQIITVLKEQFGLSATEQEQCLATYEETTW